MVSATQPPLRQHINRGNQRPRPAPLTIGVTIIAAYMRVAKKTAQTLANKQLDVHLLDITGNVVLDPTNVKYCASRLIESTCFAILAFLKSNDACIFPIFRKSYFTLVETTHVETTHA
jgi:hypothetical protein